MCCYYHLADKEIEALRGEQDRKAGIHIQATRFPNLLILYSF